MQPDDRPILMTIKVSGEEMDAFKTAAETSGLTLSAWARLLLRRAAGLPTI